MLRSQLVVALGVCVSATSPISASTIVIGYNFSFTSGPTGDNNSYTGRADDGSTITAMVSGWNASRTSGGQYVVTRADLGHSGGLGVTSGANDTTSGTFICTGTGSCGTNQIDNMGSRAGSSSIDFVHLSFSAPVVLGSVSRTSARISNGTWFGTDLDDDFSYGSGAAIVNGQMFSTLNAILGINVSDSGSCTLLINCVNTSTVADATQATGVAASRDWYISASIGSNYGGDGLVDAFKLTGITSYTHSAVPGPGTWMEMILGFGGIGSLIRRHKGCVRLLMGDPDRPNDRTIKKGRALRGERGPSTEQTIKS